ncbi:MAG: tetratricopeptide repeat protein, partial [Parabacteroides gordonii]|nr:tetratricopeptide repeat protein [Parabacteroides gordonii]
IRITLVLVITAFTTLCSCNRYQEKNTRLFQQAEQALAEQPASALSLIQSIEHPEKLSKKEYAKYWMLKIQAHEKTGANIKDDSLIHISATFYSQARDSLNAAKANLYTARVYFARNKNEEAMKYLLIAKDFAEGTKNNDLLGSIYYNIGNAYNRNCNYKKALESFKISQDYYSKSKNKVKEILTLEYIGAMFAEEAEQDSAQYYYQQVLDYTNNTGDDWLIARINRRMACMYLDLEQYAKAREYAGLSMGKDEKAEQALWNNWVISNCLLQEGDIEEAIKYAKKMPDRNYWDQPESKLLYHTLMSKIYEAKEDPESSLQETKMINQLQDQIYKTAMNNSIPYIRELHEKEQMEKIYNQIAEHRFKLIILVIMIILLGVRTGWFVMNYIKRKKGELQEAGQTLNTFREMLSEQAIQLQEYNQVLSERDEKNEQLRNFLMDKLDIARKVAQMNVVSSNNTKEFMIQFQKVFGKNMMDWENIYPVINDLYNGFVDKIKTIYPDLSNKDLQLCCFVRAGFRSDEQAVLLGYTQNSIRVKRTQLVKKMKFDNAESFHSYLMDV